MLQLLILVPTRFDLVFFDSVIVEQHVGIEVDDPIVRYWIIRSVNQRGTHNERALILTTKGWYRYKVEGNAPPYPR